MAPGALFEGLIAHWSFDDGAGTTMLTLTDTVHHYDGTLLSDTATWFQDHGPRLASAARCTSTAAVQSEVQVPTFPQPTGSWSVAGWVRAPAGDTNHTYATIVSTEIPVTATGLDGEVAGS